MIDFNDIEQQKCMGNVFTWSDWKLETTLDYRNEIVCGG